MHPLCSCGRFHEPCASDLRLRELARLTREDPRVFAAEAATETAWRAKQENRGLEFKEWVKLDKAWRDASDAAREVFSAVWREMAERLKEAT